ncbi:uncharacterized protein JCM10292_003220 [Rhodotorula paludigena]|uniref:uncharacterized protein n=1 Tax=Rhodotorula paludigena TaxID=86838 RepID=UPI00316B2730
MLFYFDDNTDGAVAYSTGWVTYVNGTGAVNATGWYGNTFHSCSANNDKQTAAGCNATITFSGSKIWVMGDYNPNHGIFYCALLDAHQPWQWYNGSTLSTPAGGRAGLNRTRCALDGLGTGQHTLLFGQTFQGVEDVRGNGITIDYYVVDNATASADQMTWTSDFIAGQPDDGYGWTTQNASSVTTSSAVSSFTSSSASDTPTSSSDSGLSTGAAAGIGAGVGVGGALLLGALVAWCYLRQRRKRVEDDGFTVTTEQHHGYQAPSSASPDRTSGVVPYMSATTSQAPATPTDMRGSEFGVPEVQESPRSGVVPYMSRAGYSPSSASALDSPASFRHRGM